MERKKIEEILGIYLPEDLYQIALRQAERKQQYIYDQCHKPEVMQGEYRDLLALEYVNQIVFSKSTVDWCRTLHDMEKEHSVNDQSAQMDTHIVAGSALRIN